MTLPPARYREAGLGAAEPRGGAARKEGSVNTIARLRDEHSFILREMKGIGEMFLEPDPGRLEELRERLGRLCDLILRHERFEEQWMTEALGPERFPDTEVESVRREHGEILSCVGSLQQTVAGLKKLPSDRRRHGPDREIVRSEVERIFRFVREHIEREGGIFPGGPSAESGK